MKALSILFIGLAVAAAQPALAGRTWTDQGLGAVHGTLEACTRMDEKNAAKYRAGVQELLQDVAADELAAAQQTPAYKAAFEAAREELSALGAQAPVAAIQRCRESLAATR